MLTLYLKKTVILVFILLINIKGFCQSSIIKQKDGINIDTLWIKNLKLRHKSDTIISLKDPQLSFINYKVEPNDSISFIEDFFWTNTNLPINKYPKSIELSNSKKGSLFSIINVGNKFSYINGFDGGQFTSLIINEREILAKEISQFVKNNFTNSFKTKEFGFNRWNFAFIPDKSFANWEKYKFWLNANKENDKVINTLFMFCLKYDHNDFCKPYNLGTDGKYLILY